MEQGGIASLILLARELVAAEIDPNNSEAFERLMASVERYSEEFGNWYAAYEEGSESSADVEMLLQLHQSIIKRVQGLQKETSGAMRRFQRKAKGIMAYTDIFPRKISVTKPHKG